MKRGGLPALENRAILGIDKLDFSSLYADWGQIRGLERGSSGLWILTQGVFRSRHCCFRDVLNGGELKVEDAITHSPEYLLSSSYISLLLFLRFFFFNRVLFQYRSHHCPYVDAPLREGPCQLWVVWGLGLIKEAANSLKAQSEEREPLFPLHTLPFFLLKI